ncbi:hypothetical protein ACFFSH_34640 [Streptomyces filamentosus]|uniref:hypothetical protein n=1 Tax=Streptomyces filamentosus TaxID=67294 RepID=UPI00167BFC53|nr:hypothetical protein [Streptomyces filamentosus]
MLVLVVDEREKQVVGDDGELGESADPILSDAPGTGVDAFGDGVAEGGKPFDGQQDAAELLRVGRPRPSPCSPTRSPVPPTASTSSTPLRSAARA